MNTKKNSDRSHRDKPFPGEVSGLVYYPFALSAHQARKAYESSAPAEKEEEWWKKDAGAIVEDGGFENSDFSHRIYVERIGKLIAEAKRRGEEKAWKEAMELAKRHSERNGDGFMHIKHCHFVCDAADKLESLNKPAEAGEK